MTNRKQIQLDRFKEEINRVWSLSIIENEVIDSILNLFLTGENNKIKQIEHLLNDETEQLLTTLIDRDVINYVTDNWEFITPDDKSGLEDALDDLYFDWISKVDCDDMADYLEKRGYSVEEESNDKEYDIITTMQLEEMTELFLSADNSKREEIINKLKH